MFDLTWRDAKRWRATTQGKGISAALPDRQVTHAALLLWEEHCVECSIPDCYTSCPLYVARRIVRMAVEDVGLARVGVGERQRGGGAALRRGRGGQRYLGHEVRVRIDSAGQHIAAGRVDPPPGGPIGPADLRDPLAGDQQVGLARPVRRHDRPADDGSDGTDVRHRGSVASSRTEPPAPSRAIASAARRASSCGASVISSSS